MTSADTEAFLASDAPPERGWKPFLDWMRRNHLVPDVTRSLRITDGGQSALVEVYVSDETGRYIVDGDEVRTETFVAPLSSPPPLHPMRGG